MKEKVYDILKKLQINYEITEHPALFTAEDSEKYGVTIDGVDCKNLFLRNKDKSQYYLVSLPLEKRANLKELQNVLKESKLSFGSDEALYEKLGIKSGSVSVLNIIEIEKTDVKFIIDKNLLKVKKVGFHPNENTVTIIFNPNEIEKILKKYNAKYEFIDL